MTGNYTKDYFSQQLEQFGETEFCSCGKESIHKCYHCGSPICEEHTFESTPYPDSVYYHCKGVWCDRGEQ